LLKGVSETPRVHGIMARLPTARAKEFSLLAATEGFSLVDHAPLDQEDYEWWVYKR
jgi:hypothetical protein